jgi:solute:Na+ symporter, SSS family
MFWKRATANGAFFGLLGGTLAAAIHHGLTLPAGAAAGIKGGWLPFASNFAESPYPSDMAKNFWMAIYAWTACFVVTIVVSLFTRPRNDNELVGLVYSLTERPKDAGGAWYSRPAVLGVAVLVAAAALNALFW